MPAWRLVLLLVALAAAEKEPILSLPLTLSSKLIETSFSIGHSSIRVSVDLAYSSLDVCCKNADTWVKRVLFFMVNPFRQIEDYGCKSGESGTKENDTATFEQIGPLSIQFNEIVYPTCDIGRLGLNRKSEFLALMPASNRFFVVGRGNDPDAKEKHWKLTVGGKVDSQFSFLPVLEGEDWRVSLQEVRFNDVPFPNQTLKFVSDTYRLAIPSRIYSFVRHELITNFDCVSRGEQLYCPCAGGISSSFPHFTLAAEGFTMSVLESSYLEEHDEVCWTILEEGGQDWQVNVLLLESVEVLFDFGGQRVGVARQRQSIDKNGLINEPLQIILNCAVILLLCFFVAMVLIELVKYLVGLEHAANDSFENYMLKRPE